MFLLIFSLLQTYTLIVYCGQFSHGQVTIQRRDPTFIHRVCLSIRPLHSIMPMCTMSVFMDTARSDFCGHRMWLWNIKVYMEWEEWFLAVCMNTKAQPSASGFPWLSTSDATVAKCGPGIFVAHCSSNCAIKVAGGDLWTMALRNLRRSLPPPPASAYYIQLAVGCCLHVPFQF